MRQVARLSPYLSQPEPVFRVIGPGHASSDHSSLAEAQGAAEASLG